MASKAYIGTANQYIHIIVPGSQTHTLLLIITVPCLYVQTIVKGHALATNHKTPIRPQRVNVIKRHIIATKNSTQAVTGGVKYHNIPKRQVREELPNHVNI